MDDLFVVVVVVVVVGPLLLVAGYPFLDENALELREAELAHFALATCCRSQAHYDGLCVSLLFCVSFLSFESSTETIWGRRFLLP